MATTISHGAMGVTACLAATTLPFGYTETIVILAMLTSGYAAYHSMQPDIIGIKGGSAKGKWGTYNSAHYGAIAEAKRMLPWWNAGKWFFLFHLWWDLFFHNMMPPYKWKPSGIAYEIIQDAVILAALWLMVGWLVTGLIVILLAAYFATAVLEVE